MCMEWRLEGRQHNLSMRTALELIAPCLVVLSIICAQRDSNLQRRSRAGTLRSAWGIWLTPAMDIRRFQSHRMPCFGVPQAYSGDWGGGLKHKKQTA